MGHQPPAGVHPVRSALFSPLARVVPFFTNFVGFYLMRSAFLFLIPEPHQPGLLLAALPRCFCCWTRWCSSASPQRSPVTWSVNHGGWTRRNITICIVLLCAAALGTYLTTALPLHGDVQIERSVMLFSFYMIFLYGWCVGASRVFDDHPQHQPGLRHLRPDQHRGQHRTNRGYDPRPSPPVLRLELRAGWERTLSSSSTGSPRSSYPAGKTVPTPLRTTI